MKLSITPFIWLTVFAVIYELAGTLVLKINTTYWFQLYSFLEIITLYLFYYRLLKPSYKVVFRLFLFLMVIMYCVSFYFWSADSNFTSKAINTVPVTLFVFMFSVLWFRELFRKMDLSNPWQEPAFYFVTGFSVYYSGTFFLFLLSNAISDSNVYFYDYWFVNILATLIFRIYLIVGAWKMQ